VVCVVFELLQHVLTAYSGMEVLFEFGGEGKPLFSVDA